MVDWQGLLKWSINQTDGTKASEFKPMDQDTKKWLESAFEDFSMGDVNAIKEIIKQLQEPEKNNADDEKIRINLLEELEIKLEDLDRPMLLFQIGGQPVLINTMLNSIYPEVQSKAFLIFAAGVQNNTVLQYESIQLGAFKLLNILISDRPQKVKDAASSALSSLVRGELLEGKRIFIQMDGVEFCLKMIKEAQSKKIQQKCCSILKDLVFYDQRLHLTHNDISKFTNTNASQIPTQKNKEESKQAQVQKSKGNKGDSYIPLSFDTNDQLSKQNMLEKNAKYKDCVKIKLIQSNFIKNYAYLIEDINIKNSDNRLAFLEIVLHISKFSQEQIVKKDSDLYKIFSQFQVNILKENQQNGGSNEQEIYQLTEIMKLIK